MALKCKELTAKFLILLSVVIASVYAQPKLLTQPRFFAEEGTSYFSFAFNHSGIESICHSQYGYFTLYNNLVTSLATIFPLELSPFVTTYSAFMVLIIATCVVISVNISGLDSYLKRFILAISIHQLLYATAWLNTIGVQYVLCIIAYLILLENTDSINSFSVTLRCLVLFICGLTGVTSCFLIPGYMLKAIKLRSKNFAMYSCVLISCVLFQIYTFFTAVFSNDPTLSGRFIHHDMPTIIGIFFKFITYQFFVPFLGLGILDTKIINYVELKIANTFTSIRYIGYEIMPVIIGILILMFILALIAKTMKSFDVQLFSICFIITTTLSTILSINMSGGPRYTYVPSIMLIIFFLTNLNNSAISSCFRYTAVTLILSSVLFNMIERPILLNGFAYNDNWPNWKKEVQMWRQNDDYILKIWPPPWQMVLHKN